MIDLSGQALNHFSVSEYLNPEVCRDIKILRVSLMKNNI